ncbi:MAG TPA: Stf0 family sulfotransferase [Cyclobacteriaceae bacterium]
MYNYFLHVHTYLIIKRKQWVEALSRTKNYSYTPFVILCAPRSGSTLLHTCLNFHPHIKSYGEILREHFESNNIDKNVTGLVKRLAFKPHSVNCKAVGLKVFYEYYNQSHYAACFQEVVDRKDVKIIHLIRKDILKLYVSLKIAERTNVWSTGKTSTHERGVDQITIDTADYLQFRNEYWQHQQLFTNMFQDHAMLEISYEALAEHPDDVLKHVQQFLGVKPQQLKTLLKKQSKDDVKMHITNYDEVQKLSMLI